MNPHGIDEANRGRCRRTDLTVTAIIARRTALAAGVAGAGAIALTACSSSGSSSKQAESAKTTEPSPSSQTVAKLADIKVGEAIAAKIGGKDVLVSRPTETTAVCFSAICTHRGCTVAPAGTKLECPCHHSMFDPKTGAVLSGPAPAPLNKVAVSVKNGEIVTAQLG